MFRTRISKLRNLLKDKNIDAVLVSNFYNVLYLTGFKTLTTDEREAFVLVTENNMYLFTDSRYIQKNFEFRISNFKLRRLEPKKGLIAHLQEITKDEKIKNLGFEAEDLRFNEFNTLKQKLANVNFIPTAKLIIEIREIKDVDEIEKVKTSCLIADKCLLEISPLIREGISEKELAFKIEYWIKEKNYDLAFDPIVAFDKNSSIPHYNTKTGNAAAKKGSVILIDFGVKYKDYLSDISRMFFLGKPKDEIINIYNILLDAQEKTLKSVSKTDNLKDVDIFCRQLISKNRLLDYSHSTGHGVGLEIHEYPKISLNSQDIKKQNQVFTIEPGVYIEGEFGMRIEDTITIDNNLNPIILTKFPKSFRI